MSAYIQTITLMDNTVASESSGESTFADYAEGASRLFDKLCEVEDGFFDKAPTAPSAQTFYGNGIDMIRLPPFVGTPTLTIDAVAPDAADYRIANGYLYNLAGDFDADSTIIVTARWGFAEIPADVKMVVNELGIYLYRNRDPLFTKMSDAETERELSPTVNAAIKKYRDKYSQMAY